MDKVAQSSLEDLQALFEKTAEEKALDSIIVEKDFWVCWTLKRLAQLGEDLPAFVFKGGTSLSKAYGLIHRFSEDIDLCISRSALGFEGEKDPASLEKVNQRKKAIKKLLKACKAQVHDNLYPALETSIRAQLGEHGWHLEPKEDHKLLNLHFHYPRSLEAENYQNSPYIEAMVRLEIGPRGDQEPSELRPIQSYVAEAFPDEFQEPQCEVPTLSAERTFWEKAFIFHRENHRVVEKNATPVQWNRTSRHAYDLFMMDRAGVSQKAIEEAGLKEAVIRFNEVFFADSYTPFEKARQGEFKLVPRDQFQEALRLDYSAMQVMLFETDVPSFDDILSNFTALEERINAAKA